MGVGSLFKIIIFAPLFFAILTKLFAGDTFKELPKTKKNWQFILAFSAFCNVVETNACPNDIVDTFTKPSRHS